VATKKKKKKKERKKKERKRERKRKKGKKNLSACDTVPRPADHWLLAALRISFCFFCLLPFSLFSPFSSKT